MRERSQPSLAPAASTVSSAARRSGLAASALHQIRGLAALRIAGGLEPLERPIVGTQSEQQAQTVAGDGHIVTTLGIERAAHCVYPGGGRRAPRCRRQRGATGSGCRCAAA